MSNKKVAILGDGGWGTALALVLARKHIPSVMWGPFPEYLAEISHLRENKRYLPGFELPKDITFHDEISDVVQSAEVVLSAVPTAYLRATAAKIPNDVWAGKIIVSCTKGIEHETLYRPSQIWEERVSPDSVVVLSGPSHAEEVAKNIPTCVVVGGKNKELAKHIQTLFMEDRFRVYTSHDAVGVELGGALKNVIAVAAGICDGLGFGSNTKAALLSRGLQEITRLGCAMKASGETFFGLSGMGDLVTTCFSSFGRNRSVGERIGKGEKLPDIIASMSMVAEGVYTTQSAYHLSLKHEIDMPITQEVYNVLHAEKDPLQSISDLMLRGLKDEMPYNIGK